MNANPCARGRGRGWATLTYIVPAQIQKRGNVWTPRPWFITKMDERNEKGIP